jgi:hypothetical protein
LPSVTLEKYAAAATLTIAEPAWDEKTLEDFAKSDCSVPDNECD